MYLKYKNKEKRREYLRKWRIRNRKRLNKYLRKYLKDNNKSYYNKSRYVYLMNIHRKIEKKLGKPRYCETCKRTDKKVYCWSNKNHRYSLDKKYWQRLCSYCHCKYDRKFNGRKTYLEK